MLTQYNAYLDKLLFIDMIYTITMLRVDILCELYGGDSGGDGGGSWLDSLP